jgi:hypothetical protein
MHYLCKEVFGLLIPVSQYEGVRNNSHYERNLAARSTHLSLAASACSVAGWSDLGEKDRSGKNGKKNKKQNMKLN